MKRAVIVSLVVVIAFFAAAAYVTMRSETHAAAFVQELFQPTAETEPVCGRPKEVHEALQRKCGEHYTAVFEGDGKGKCDRFVGCARMMY